MSEMVLNKQYSEINSAVMFFFVRVPSPAGMAHIIIIRNCHCYYITKSAPLDNMDGSDDILS